jgi:hypothetical protein
MVRIENKSKPDQSFRRYLAESKMDRQMNRQTDKGLLQILSENYKVRTITCMQVSSKYHKTLSKSDIMQAH